MHGAPQGSYREKQYFKTGKFVNTRVNEIRHELVGCVGFCCLAGIQMGSMSYYKKSYLL